MRASSRNSTTVWAAALLLPALLGHCDGDEKGAMDDADRTGADAGAGGTGGHEGGTGAVGGEGARAGDGGDNGAGAGGSGAGDGGTSGAGASGGEGGEGLAGGSGGSAGDGPLSFTEAPRLAMSSVSNTPLWAELRLATNRPTKVSVTTKAGSRSWSREFPEPRTQHVLTLLRFFPGTAHSVSVSVEDEKGAVLTYSKELEAIAPPLPADFPKLSVPVSTPGAMEPGVILMAVRGSTTPGSYVIVLDKTGQVLWFHYTADYKIGDMRRLPNGNLLWLAFSRRDIVEMDMRGNVVRAYRTRGPVARPEAQRRATLAGGVEPIEVATDSFHHEALGLESGNLLALTSEMRTFENYPTSEVDPTPRVEPLNVVGDGVVEFSPSGEVLNRWSLMDLLDPYRVGWNSYANNWQLYYDDPTAIDWGHSNAVAIDPRDGALVVSVRNQDAVVKFTRSGKLVWLLADPANWDERFVRYLLRPTSKSFAWQYHQHASKITSRGTLLLFDNGWRRACAPDPGLPEDERYSRAVEFDIDETALEVTTVWDYGSAETGSARFYSMTMGDVDELPTTGNILVTITSTKTPPPEDELSTVLRELTRSMPPKVVFEARVDDDETSSDKRTAYRAEHLPDVYPE